MSAYHRRAADGLQRRYERLMLAYPRAYRREHGAEIVTTLLDGAAPGRERPTAAEVRNLLAGGLRQRFRLPVGRLMVVVAVLTALTGGAVGAGLGSALAWTTAVPAPDAGVVARLTDLVFAGLSRGEITSPWDTDGLRYQFTATASDLEGTWSLDKAADRLAAAGWTVHPARSRPIDIHSFGPDGDAVRPADLTDLAAERDGLALEMIITRVPGERATVALYLRPNPPSALPFTLAGAVAGLLGGWLLTARTGYRLRHAPNWARGALNGLALTSGLALAPSTIGAWVATWWAVEVAVSGLPGRLGGPAPAAYEAYTASSGPARFAMQGLLLGALFAALTLLIRRRRPEPEPVS